MKKKISSIVLILISIVLVTFGVSSILRNYERKQAEYEFLIYAKTYNQMILPHSTVYGIDGGKTLPIQRLDNELMSAQLKRYKDKIYFHDGKYEYQYNVHTQKIKHRQYTKGKFEEAELVYGEIRKGQKLFLYNTGYIKGTSKKYYSNTYINNKKTEVESDLMLTVVTDGKNHMYGLENELTLEDRLVFSEFLIKGNTVERKQRTVLGTEKELGDFWPIENASFYKDKVYQLYGHDKQKKKRVELVALDISTKKMKYIDLGLQLSYGEIINDSMIQEGKFLRFASTKGHLYTIDLEKEQLVSDVKFKLPKENSGLSIPGCWDKKEFHVLAVDQKIYSVNRKTGKTTSQKIGDFKSGESPDTIIKIEK